MWEERIKQMKQPMAMRQNIRSHNLQNHKINGSIPVNFLSKRFLRRQKITLMDEPNVEEWVSISLKNEQESKNKSATTTTTTTKQKMVES